MWKQMTKGKGQYNFTGQIYFSDDANKQITAQEAVNLVDALRQTAKKGIAQVQRWKTKTKNLILIDELTIGEKKEESPEYDFVSIMTEEEARKQKELKFLFETKKPKREPVMA